MSRTAAHGVTIVRRPMREGRVALRVACTAWVLVGAACPLADGVADRAIDRAGAERVLVSCPSLDGRMVAELVEPPGQWQDQFVVVRMLDAATSAVASTSEKIGFAAGSVDGLAWRADGTLALTTGPTHMPRVLYDVTKGAVVDEVPYGDPALPPPWAKACRAR